jgi:hypothetical protein
MLEKLTWSVDSLDINAVVILETKEKADIFFEKIYPLWADPIVITGDGSYPKDENVKFAVLKKLQTSENLPVIVFHIPTFKSMNVLSKNLLLMTDLIREDTFRFYEKKPFNWTDTSLAAFMNFWTMQNSKLTRVDNLDSSWKEYRNPDSLDWYHDLT